MTQDTSKTGGSGAREPSVYHARACELHAQHPVVDAHCDTITLVLDDGLDFVGGDPRSQVDLPRLRAGGVSLQVLACWNEAAHSGHAAFARCMAKIGAFHRLARQHGLRHVKGVADLDGPGVGFVLSMEDAAPCMGSGPHLEALYAAGVRMIGLTWNGRNELADGVGVGLRPGGLTDVGRELVTQMAELGIVVDLAHVSKPSFWDVFEVVSGPVAVSHANAAAVQAHRRNLDDDQIRAVAERSGVIGVTFVPSFLADGGTASVRDVVRHVNHLVATGGAGVVGLGSDFDGITVPPDGLNDVGDLPGLTAALLAEGHSEADVVGFLGGNWLRVFRAVWHG
ncbi:MAG: dipeptidase [Candidatus Sericytochromatia bacterium]|nr:dipeptidase [Candidatus Sericytochromatia bacterium]